MKKFLSSLFILLFIITIVPSFVFAEEKENEKEEVKKEPIKIYEFYGDGCGYCAASFQYFESLEEEYGDYFDLVKFEVWKSEENTALMEAVAKAYNETTSGVPYIIIGDYTLNGYSEGDNDDILNSIIKEYEKDEDSRVTTARDVIANFKFENNEPNGVVVAIIAGVILVIGIVIVVKARQE
ncbi:MAG: hypothetical protein E7162_02795 [Firmicutes bacterium]|nr:hypothetical protein [Bacillota bacterium]